MRKAFAWILGAWLLCHCVGCVAQESTSIGMTVESNSGDIDPESGMLPWGWTGAPVVRDPGDVATDVDPPPAGRAQRFDSPALLQAPASGGSPGLGSSAIGSNPVGSTAFSSTPVGSTPVGSVPLSSTPISSTPVGSTPVGSVPLSSTPTGSSPVGSSPGGGRLSGQK
jgi:hypothetical protein